MSTRGAFGFRIGGSIRRKVQDDMPLEFTPSADGYFGVTLCATVPLDTIAGKSDGEVQALAEAWERAAEEVQS